MDKKEIIRGVISFGGGCCAGSVIEEVLKNNIAPMDTKSKIIFKIGAFVIGSFISDKVSVYLEKQVDQIGEAVDKVFGKPENEELEEA